MAINIAVITGGEASEAGISLKSAGVIMKHLPRDRFTPYLIIIEGNNWRHSDSGELVNKNDFSLVLNNQQIYFDAAFIAIHGTPAEDGLLQGYFDLLKIPYSCCGVLSAALTFDKQKCKTFLRASGVNSANGFLLCNKDTDWRENQLFTQFINETPFPVFVKPNKNGSSYGASKVDDISQLESAIEKAFDFDSEILIEQYLQGTEVTCGLISVNEELIVFPVTEIRSATGFFDYAAKYEGKSREITPAEINESLSLKIQHISSNIYRQLGFKGMCRIDYIIVQDTPYMLEVNAIPGLSEESIVPQQARAFGWSLAELFTHTMDEAIRTHKGHEA